MESTHLGFQAPQRFLDIMHLHVWDLSQINQNVSTNVSTELLVLFTIIDQYWRINRRPYVLYYLVTLCLFYYLPFPPDWTPVMRVFVVYVHLRIVTGLSVIAVSLSMCVIMITRHPGGTLFECQGVGFGRGEPWILKVVLLIQCCEHTRFRIL